MADELLRALGRRQGQEPRPATDEDQGVPMQEHASTAPRADELLRPFDEAERKGVLDAVFARLDDDAPANAPSPGASEAHAVDLAARRSRGRIAAVATLATLAAALLVWFLLRPPTSPPEPAIASLPSYSITRFQGGVASTRADPSTPPSSAELAPDSEIDWVFTPRAPVHGELAVAILVEPEEGGAPTITRPEGVEISPEGVVRLQGPLDAFIAPPTGHARVHLLIGPPERLPDTPEQAREDGPWAREQVEITIVPRR